MGKLGGKARKFAKKNLQSVLKRKRKLKSSFKKTPKTRGGKGADKDTEGHTQVSHPLNGRIIYADDNEDTKFENFYSESDSESVEDDSGSDGYLSAASTDESAKTDGERFFDNSTNGVEKADIELSEENKDILLQLKKNKRILKRLKANDPKFLKLLHSNKMHAKALKAQSLYEEKVITQAPDVKMKGLLREHTIDVLCDFFKENYDAGAFLKLLNAYRTACHYGDESNHDFSSRALTKVVIFMLSEADNIFRRILGTKTVFDLKKYPIWETLRPLLKSFLRSTLHLLQQVTEPEMIAFSIVKIKPFINYFASYPYLIIRLIKILSHLWVTCQGNPSEQSFILMQDIATLSNLKWFDACFSEAYKKYIEHGPSDDSSLKNHMQFLRNSLVNLCSLNIIKSYSKAVKFVRVLRNGLLLAMKFKEKEAVNRVSSRQFINCIDFLATFISTYTSEYDVHWLLDMLIEVIISMAILFPGPRYLPLRINCIKWLNDLSSSTGVFVPVVSFILTILDNKIVKGGKNPPQELSLSSSMKLPKSWVKSDDFQEACLFSVLHLLAMHFLQWSFHISFPELAAFSIIRLKTYLDSTSSESRKRVIKRFIEQVEQNVNFVLKKRDEVAFSPNDQLAADSFLQLEKSKSNASFIQYYRSLLENTSNKSLLTTK